MAGIKRRKFISTTITLGAITLGAAPISGCVTPSQKEPSAIPEPDVPESLLRRGGWELKSTSEERVLDEEFLGGLVSVVADAYTVIYEDVLLWKKVKERTLGNIDTSLSSFFATRVAFDPNLSSIPGASFLVIDRVRKTAEEQFEDQLKKAGLTNIAKSGSDRIQVETGETAEIIKYSADYRFEPIRVPVTEEKSLTLEGGTLEVAGWFAVWKHGEFVLISGGAYPNEDFEKTANKDLTEAISVTVNIDLGLRPSGYKKELFDLIQSVK